MMSVLTEPHPRVRRKPAPSLELDARYPQPDPDDPFAPLSVLRSRTASTLSVVGPPVTFRGASTAHLPSLPYSGGRYPPDIYQTHSPSLATNAFQPRNKFPRVSLTPLDSFDSVSRTPQRRRSQSAVLKGTRAIVVPYRTSPYGHASLELARCSTPVLTASGSESLHSSASLSDSRRPKSRGLISVPSSQLHLPSFSEESLARPSSKKGRALSRFLPRLNSSNKSTDQLGMSQSTLPFPPLASARLPQIKASPSRHTFYAHPKSMALFSAAVADNLRTIEVLTPPGDVVNNVCLCEPLSDSELGYIKSPLPSHQHLLPSLSMPVDPRPTKALHSHSKTMDTCQGAGGGKVVTSVPSPHSPFNEYALPTPKQLLDASSCVLIAESGIRVPFGDLFRDQKTIVIFIRHFWCSMCQDYMFSLSNTVDPKLLKRADMNLVIIGNGSYNMIKSYRQIFRTPFAIYTDPSMRTYRALGMRSLRNDASKPRVKRGTYIRHSKVSGLAMVVSNALRVGMPIWEKGGDPSQLGGEFILGPGLTASYAHRMPNTTYHAPIMRILATAGIRMSCEAHMSTPPSVGQRAIPAAVGEEEWMEERHLSFERIRERKTARRMGRTMSTCTGLEFQLPLPRPGIEKDEYQRLGEETKNQMEVGDTYPGDLVATFPRPLVEVDADADSMESQTLTGSDTGSERTKAEVVELHRLRSRAVLLGLKDPLALS